MTFGRKTHTSELLSLWFSTLNGWKLAAFNSVGLKKLEWYCKNFTKNVVLCKSFKSTFYQIEGYNILFLMMIFSISVESLLDAAADEMEKNDAYTVLMEITSFIMFPHNHWSHLQHNCVHSQHFHHLRENPVHLPHQGGGSRMLTYTLRMPQLWLMCLCQEMMYLIPKTTR